MDVQIKEGTYDKMGVSLDKNCVTFTFEGEKEEECILVLVDKVDKNETRIAVPKEYCLGSLRSISVSGIQLQNYFYYFEISGNKCLDPYARAIEGRNVWNDTTRSAKHYELLDAFVERKFDWKEDHCPEISKEDMVIYKLHVRGFSMNSEMAAKGTFEAISNKISYLQSLGVTSLEVMPVYEFEEMTIPTYPKVPAYMKEIENDSRDVKLDKVDSKVNYWGYGNGDYFAVKASYAKNPQQASYELKKLIQKLHSNHMEFIMEMFFPEKINQNLVIDVLRFWVKEYHVDGFHVLGNSIPVTAIAQDKYLSRTKIFYTDFSDELALSCSKFDHLYVYKQEYQYPARKVLNHMNGNMVEFANQQRKQGEHLGYVNFIASNNGFTLADIFTYNDKHNELNGENNQDGEDWNLSNNQGIEGPTKKKFICASRKQKWKNAMALLMLAQGVPLIWEGDEFENSQNGNNNAYCQDNEIGWIDWKMQRRNKKDIQFVSQLAEFRKTYPVIHSRIPYRFSDYKSFGLPDISYHGDSAWLLEIERGRMNLGILYCGDYSETDKKENIYIAYNFFSAEASVALPKQLKKKKWYKIMDTSLDQPFMENEQLCDGQNLLMTPQSVCILLGK